VKLVRKGAGCLWRAGFKKKSLEWKTDGVMDDNSGDDDTGEVR